MSETPPISPPEPGVPGLGAIRSPSPSSRLRYALRHALSLPRDSALSRDFIDNLLLDAVERAIEQGVAAEQAIEMVRSAARPGLAPRTRKKPGPKPKPADERFELQVALTALSVLRSPKEAALMAAKAQMRKEGLNPVVYEAKLDQYTKTWQNQIAPARRAAMKNARATLAVIEQIKREGYPPEISG